MKDGNWNRRARLAGRLSAALAVAVAGLAALGVLGRSATPAYADGPAPCSSGGPTSPFHGYCATYGGRNTFYGSYGLGFPTPTGWGLCAENAATGGVYPSPSFGYSPAGAPAGADTQNDDALGFALSQAQAAGWWTNGQGPSSADDFAAAGKILYDNVVWGQGVPSMPYGTLNAFNELQSWYNQAAGATGSPTLTMGIAGGGTTFNGSAFVQLHVQFPGSGSPTQGLGILMSVTGATFNNPAGPTTVGVSTDSGGNVTIPIFASIGGPVSVSAAASVGQVGMSFYHSGNAAAQDLAAFPTPTTLSQSLDLTNNGGGINQQGTLSIGKQVDDGSYYGPAGAVFDIEDGSGILQALTTGSDGTTPESIPLAAGPYTIHESLAPSGYSVAPDQSVTVVPFVNTVVSYSGAFEDHIQPTKISIFKGTQGAVSTPIAGAVFDFRYDEFNSGSFGDDLGTCTTDASGSCLPPSNDGPGNSFLPGYYQVTEVQSPPGYYTSPPTTITEFAGPASGASFFFADFVADSVQIEKSGDDAPYAPVEGAVFSLVGPLPSNDQVGTLTIGPNGQSNVVGNLTSGSYTLTEITPPAGYQPIAAQTISLPPETGSAPAPVTVIDVLDHVQPASVIIQKIDQATNAPLAGAVFDVRYDPTDSGTYSSDLGECTTSAGGTCAPPGNDGPSQFLPGNYQVTEVAAPPGYQLETGSATQDLTLTPGGTGQVVFKDPLLVPASFHKVATGNINAAQVTYAGAVIQVLQGTASGPVLTTCTTDASGNCSTPAVLVSGQPYCWNEVSAPPGLAGGAHGCFTADNGQGAQPIMVTDPGEFSGVVVKKVDGANPSVVLPGAAIDLYRVDKGTGPGTVPAPPSNAKAEAGETWVARATTGSNGVATFPLQYPGYSYCAVEEAAPDNYRVFAGQQCSPMLAGATATPPAVTTITMGDTEATVTLSAHKYNSLMPSTVIPGATYDLYVEGNVPPGGVPNPAPTPAPAPELGDTWYDRGTTDATGNLSFTLPAGFAWCLLEVSAPANYSLDPALHCTAVLNASAPPSATTIALPETLATVYLSAHKFNSLNPSSSVPGATYELLVQGTRPPNPPPGAAPANAQVPAGDTYWAQGTSDSQGQLLFGVPAGYSWCLHEIPPSPAGYQLDPGFHCTAVLNSSTPPSAMSIALAETPTPTSPPGVPIPMLPFTGAPSLWLVWGGSLLTLIGAGLLLLSRRTSRKQE